MANLHAPRISLPVHPGLIARTSEFAHSRPAAQAPVFFSAGTEIYAQGERCSGLYKISIIYTT